MKYGPPLGKKPLPLSATSKIFTAVTQMKPTQPHLLLSPARFYNQRIRTVSIFPPYFTYIDLPCSAARNPSSHSLNKVDTQVVSAASQPSPTPKSATRRRLPPTPGGPSPPVTSPSISLSMPEPEPYHPAGSSKPSVYNPASYTPFAPSSNGVARPTTADSDNSTTSGRRLPTAPGYSNGSSQLEERTPISSSDYQSHGSFSSSFGSHTTNSTPSTTGDGQHRPPGAQPPALPPKPSAYQDFSSESQYSYQSLSFNTYDRENNDYFYGQPQQTQQSRPHQYGAIALPPPPPPLPPPPPPPPPPTATTNDNLSDYPPQTADTTSPVALSPGRSFSRRTSQARIFIIF